MLLITVVALITFQHKSPTLSGDAPAVVSRRSNLMESSRTPPIDRGLVGGSLAASAERRTRKYLLGQAA